jgi:crotonobetainyl-CoA:carnitine CoA-transferase CaiB-like acyl-CoA transferase
MERLGLDYDSVAKLNPMVVYCSISGYGQTGLKRDVAAHDLNYIGDAGLLALSMGDLSRPVVPPALIADIAGGAYPAVLNILLALEERRRTGRGRHLDVAMADNLFALMFWARSNRNSGRRSATLSVWRASFATMRKIPRRRKPALPPSLRARQQTSGVRVSPAKIVAARSSRASLMHLPIPTMWLVACSTTCSPIPREPLYRRSPCRSIRAFVQPPKRQSLRLPWAPITRRTWGDGPQRASGLRDDNAG